MAADVGVVRDEESLTNALATIVALEQDAHGDRRLANMLSTAKLIAAAALCSARRAAARISAATIRRRMTSFARRSFLTLADAEGYCQRGGGKPRGATPAACRAGPRSAPCMSATPLSR